MTNPACGRILILSLCACTLLLGCSDDENPLIDLNDSSTLAGSYRLVSVTDYSGEMGPATGITFVSGEPVSIQVEEGVTATMTITGTLTLTETRYSMSMTVTMAALGASNSDTTTDTGTYSIQGSTMTIVSDDEGEGPDSMTITVDGNKITLKDSDMNIVFEKQ